MRHSRKAFERPIGGVLLPGADEISTPQLDPYILWSFLLDTTRDSRNNPASCCFEPQGDLEKVHPRPLGEATCNICRAGLCSASIRLAPQEVTGCALIFRVLMQVWSFVLLAETHCRPCRRRLARDSECARAYWPHARPCGRGPASKPHNYRLRVTRLVAASMVVLAGEVARG